MKRKNKLFSFALLWVGLAFFANPCFAALDPLPDFLGCLLILLPLSRLSHTHPHFADVRRAVLRLALVDVGKFLCFFVVFGSAGAAERPTSLLIVSFCAAVLTAWFAVTAVRGIFDGILILALDFDAHALYSGRKENASITDKMRRFFLFFILFREVACTLPEFLALEGSSPNINLAQRNLYQFIGVVRAMACLPVLILGIVCVVLLCRYARAVHRETAMRTKLAEECETYLAQHPGIKVLQRHGIAFVCLSLGALFLADFYIDYRNILPDIVGIAFFAVGILLLSLPLKQKVPTFLSGTVFAVFACLSTKFSYQFATSFTAHDIARDEMAASAYTKMWTFSLLEFLAFAVFLAFLMLLLRKTVFAYAGYRPTYNTFEERWRVALKEEFDGSFLLCYALGFISGLCSFLYDYLQEIPESGFWRLLEFFWAVDFIVALLFAAYLIRLLYRIYGEIVKRYQFE